MRPASAVLLLLLLPGCVSNADDAPLKPGSGSTSSETLQEFCQTDACGILAGTYIDVVLA